jgi:hypothetical protein
MIYTQEQLNEMSDHEINIAVADKRGLQLGSNWSYQPTMRWDEVMPIAEKYGIDVTNSLSINATNDVADWLDEYYIGVLSSSNKNPKRAVCEVFLQLEINEDC